MNGARDLSSQMRNDHQPSGNYSYNESASLDESNRNTYLNSTLDGFQETGFKTEHSSMFESFSL